MALNIEEPQILLQYDDDAVPYHHRILIRRLKEATWVVVTPEGELQVETLADYSMLPLMRAGSIPTVAEAAGCHLFSQPVDDELPGWHAQAARLAMVLGGPGSVEPSGSITSTWRIADTSSAEFGSEVAGDVVLNPATGVVRGAVGLAQCGSPARRTFVELVPTAEVGQWEADKHTGAGRDPRLAGPQPTFAGASVPLSDALRSFRPRDLQGVPGWPHQGPRASVELLQGIQTLGLSAFTYHDHWVRQVGIHGDSAIAWEHKLHMNVLAMAIGYDRLDPTNTAALELVTRRVLMIERAARVSPKARCFTGFGRMIEHALDEQGGVATREFTAHIADQRATTRRS